MAEVIRYCPMCGKLIRKRNKKYCCDLCGRMFRRLKRQAVKKDG